MLYTGLSKGVMHCAGIGAHNAWTLTKRNGEMNSIWKLFSDRLPNLQQATFFMGKDYFLIKKSDHCLSQNQIPMNHIKRFITGGNITGTRLAQIVSCIDTVAQTLHNKEVRIFNNMFFFRIISQDCYDKLILCGEEKTEGLYANKYGFCQIPHQKRVCKIYKEKPCIFVKACRLPDGNKAFVKRYYCGKFNQKFATRRIALLASGKIAGTIGSCEDLRGFEI